MRNIFVLALASLVLVTMVSETLQALAHGVQRPCNPYTIVETCDGNGHGCKARLRYTRGHSLDAAPNGSYFYRKPHRWHHHDMFRHVHHVRYEDTGWETRKIVKYKRICVPHHHHR